MNDNWFVYKYYNKKEEIDELWCYKHKTEEKEYLKYIDCGKVLFPIKFPLKLNNLIITKENDTIYSTKL